MPLAVVTTTRRSQKDSTASGGATADLGHPEHLFFPPVGYFAGHGRVFGIRLCLVTVYGLCLDTVYGLCLDTVHGLCLDTVHGLCLDTVHGSQK